MNRVPLLLLAATLPLLASCSDAPPTAPLAPDAPSFARSAHKAKPFNGRCDTQVSPVASQPGDPQASQRLHLTYVCQLQHLGRTTAIAEQLVLFTGPGTLIASNSTVYTAANGDQLYSTFTGPGTADADGGIVFSGLETYTGGTGRFAGASGSSVISGTASVAGLPPFAGQFTLDGTLSY
jgi:hypothetical protein